MDDFSRDLIKYIIIAFAIGAVWNVIAVSYLLHRRKKRGVVFPSGLEGNVKYCVKRVSGFSSKAWYTRLGAANCLTVIVNDTHFAVTTYFPFTALAGTFDLEHLVPLDKIRGVLVKGKRVRVKFEIVGELRQMSLYLHDPGSLMEALQDCGLEVSPDGA